MDSFAAMRGAERELRGDRKGQKPKLLLGATSYTRVVRGKPLYFFSTDLRSLGTETMGYLEPQRDIASKSLFFSYLSIFQRGHVWTKTFLYWAGPSLVLRHNLFLAPPTPIWRQPNISPTIPNTLEPCLRNTIRAKRPLPLSCRKGLVCFLQLSHLKPTQPRQHLE